MGIIQTVNCCRTQKSQLTIQKSHIKTIKKSKDPLSQKQDYQKTLQDILNTALSKFQQKNKIIQLKINGIIGIGSQGSVFQVDMIYQKNGIQLIKKLAMKRINKHKLDKQKAKANLLLQKQIMTNSCSSFITSIEFACQDDDYLYFFMDLAVGGDGFGLISQEEKQSLQTGKAYKSRSKANHFRHLGENGVIFLLAGVILGIQSLHKLNVIYRDLKPQNILLFQDGYPKLADFGVSIKQETHQLIYQLKGTVLYFAPEVIKKKGYDRGVDLWALGVLTYELMFQEVPFSFSTVKSKNFQKICSQKWKNEKWPSRFSSPQMKDFIKKLLCLDPKSRLGYSSFENLKNHDIFKQIDWKKYEKKQIQSPLKQLVKKHPLQVKKEQQQDQFIANTLDEPLHISFTYVRFSQYQTRSSLKKTSNTFIIESGLQMKFIQNQQQMEMKEIQS